MEPEQLWVLIQNYHHTLFFVLWKSAFYGYHTQNTGPEDPKEEHLEYQNLAVKLQLTSGQPLHS